jgi:hypothetical protein
MKPTLARVLAPSLVALSIALYFTVFIAPSLVDSGPGRMWADYDYQSYFLPRFVMGSKALLAGRLPLWNPYEFGGLPFLATGQPAVFYPPMVLTYGVLSPVTAHWVFLIVHYLVLAGAFLLFLRNRGLVGVPAFIGTAIWVFSVPLLNSNYHPNRIASMVWVPFLFLLADRAAAGSKKALGLFALVIAVMLTAGYPVLAIHVALLLGIHAIVCFAVGEVRSPPWRTLPVLAGAFLLGAIAAAAQLLPLAELGRVAARTKMASLPSTVDLTELPHPLLSIVPALIVFALVGLPLVRARAAVVNWAVCIALGEGGWKLLRALPGFSMTRFPFAWLFLIPFFAGWTAAVGADALFSSESGARTRRLALVVVAGGAFAVAIAYAVALVAPGMLDVSHELSLFRYNAKTTFSALLGIAACVAMIALSFAERRGRAPPAAWLAASFCAVVSHLGSAPFASVSAPFTRPTPVGAVEGLYGRSRPIEGRTLSLFDLRFGYEITDELPSPLGVESSFLPVRYAQILEKLDVMVPLQTLGWTALARAPGFLDAMNVELLLVPDEVAPLFMQHGFMSVRHADRASLLRKRDRLGPAWVNYAVYRASSEKDALDTVFGESFDPRREVVVEDELHHDFPATTDELATPAFARPTTDPNHAEFDVTLTKPGVFVVSASAYPGFRATVDGAPVEWKTADFVLRAVELEPGHHVVGFDYRPASVRRGLWVSALGLVAIAALLLVAWRPPRSPARTPL